MEQPALQVQPFPIVCKKASTAANTMNFSVLQQ